MTGTPIYMPKLGMSMEEGRVVAWPLEIGAHVAKGDIVLIIESEKAEVEIEATASGYFRHVYVEVDETVTCGTLLAALTESMDESFDALAYVSEQNIPPAREERSKTSAVEERATFSSPRKIVATPAARSLAKRLNFDLQLVNGTGPGGRITKEDVANSADQNLLLKKDSTEVSLEVLVEGEGPSLVILPGFGSDASSFSMQSARLVDQFKIHVVHSRGIRQSLAPGLDPIFVETLAEDAGNAVTGPVHVVGASLGAAVAIDWAIKEPDRIKSLTLITPFVYMNGRLSSVLRSWASMAADVSADLLSASLLPWLFSAKFLEDREQYDRMQRGLAQMVACADGAVLKRYVEGVSAWSGTREADLGKIISPTLILAGAEDLLTPDAKSIAALVPNAKFESIPEAGHALCMEAPDVVASAIRSHIGNFQ